MDMGEFMKITKGLSDPNRVRILLALEQGELCVCQITELFGFANSTISKHLSVLHNAGLILSRKAERWVYYRLPGNAASPAVRESLAWVRKFAGETDEAQSDSKKLKKILATDVAEICRRQRCC
jgi:DNA-binding transcriptional ArsR family regulator